jgi:hypothetical protein
MVWKLGQIHPRTCETVFDIISGWYLSRVASLTTCLHPSPHTHAALHSLTGH